MQFNGGSTCGALEVNEDEVSPPVVRDLSRACFRVFPVRDRWLLSSLPSLLPRSVRPIGQMLFFFSLALRCGIDVQPSRNPALSSRPILPTTTYSPRSLVCPPPGDVAALHAISCAPCPPRLGNTSRPSRTNSGTTTLSARMLHLCRRCPFFLLGCRARF